MIASPAAAVIDVDSGVRRSIADVLESESIRPREYNELAEFLAEASVVSPGCVIVEIEPPRTDGLGTLRQIYEAIGYVPIIAIAAQAEVRLAVQAVQSGVIDFLTKPIDEELLRSALQTAMELSRRAADLAPRFAALTQRERDVLKHLLVGRSSKMIAVELGIANKTVEKYRSNIMHKLCAENLADFFRIVYEWKSCRGLSLPAGRPRTPAEEPAF